MHQQLRRRWSPQVATGLVPCARCGELIAPGAMWDLGHDDNDRRRYAGPEHRACNRATMSHRVIQPESVSYELARESD